MGNLILLIISHFFHCHDTLINSCLVVNHHPAHSTIRMTVSTDLHRRQLFSAINPLTVHLNGCYCPQNRTQLDSRKQHTYVCRIQRMM
jgi:hypothetical protein